eukprot:GILJ01015072.1.p1 GENE.GILJ01015072.1~~GILJ01015072.1.p1  ORF type:complete len:511 (-),score=89.49 GILJ01015072.1:11-1543(-)
MDAKRSVSMLIDTVEKTLAVTQFRNAYEVNNTFQSNTERLDSAVAAMKHIQLNGDEVDVLQRRINALRALNTERQSTFAVGHASTTSPEEWMKQLEEDAEEEEGPVIAKKPKKEKKDKKEKEKEPKRVSTPPPAPDPRQKPLASDSAKKETPTANVLHMVANCGFAGLPSSVLEGKCIVTQILNSPCVELRYEGLFAVPNSSTLGQCVVIMYRVVVAALWKGIPSVKVDKALNIQSGKPEHQQTDKHHHHYHSPPTDEAEPSAEAPEPAEGESDEEMVIQDTPDYEHESPADTPVDDAVREASEKLVQEYKEAEAEDDAEYFARGRDAPTQIIIPTPHFKQAFEAPWIVLMCHGGYFAGGVFINGKPIVHKAFQRYVVRKKQGGLQSKADKTGGVMKSAGSQIRRHNELKWKVMVRDILLSWKEHIDAAWVILYVAPGPDNRSVLTDFSNIPASFGGGSSKGCPKSPVDIKDIRVRSAPLTTHRPTFSEVQRIYHEVTRVSVRYDEPLAE